MNQRGDEVDFATQPLRIGANDESLVSKGDVWTECVTAGLPKSWKTHGNGVSIVPATVISSALYVENHNSRKGRGTVYNLLKSRNYRSLYANKQCRR